MATAPRAKRVYVYIGRFQPLHNGHVHVLARAMDKADLVVVLVGSAHQPRTVKNPFTYLERAKLIEAWWRDLPHASSDMTVRPLRDQPYNNAKWIQSVQEQVAEAVAEFELGDCEVVLTGSDKDESTWYLSAFPQWRTDFTEPFRMAHGTDATALRQMLFSSEPTWSDVPEATAAFLDEFIYGPHYDRLCRQMTVVQKAKSAWAPAPYEPIFTTVDAVVIQSGHVLAVVRGAEPGEGLWALPGGYLEPAESLLDGCLRELAEETRIKVSAPVLRGSLKGRETFDDPGRDLRGRVITVAHAFRLDDTKPLPKVRGSDDAARAFWLPISEARSRSDMWFSDHLAILDWAVGLKDMS